MPPSGRISRTVQRFRVGGKEIRALPVEQFRSGSNGPVLVTAIGSGELVVSVTDHARCVRAMAGQEMGCGLVQ